MKLGRTKFTVTIHVKSCTSLLSKPLSFCLCKLNQEPILHTFCTLVLQILSVHCSDISCKFNYFILGSIQEVIHHSNSQYGIPKQWTVKIVLFFSQSFPFHYNQLLMDDQFTCQLKQITTARDVSVFLCVLLCSVCWPVWANNGKPSSW